MYGKNPILLLGRVGSRRVLLGCQDLGCRAGLCSGLSRAEGHPTLPQEVYTITWRGDGKWRCSKRAVWGFVSRRVRCRGVVLTRVCNVFARSGGAPCVPHSPTGLWAGSASCYIFPESYHFSVWSRAGYIFRQSYFISRADDTWNPVLIFFFLFSVLFLLCTVPI